MNHQALIKSANEAKDKSYSPYSHFKVGAAVFCGSGKIYTGANIENASYGATVCAERTAIFKAVSEGEKKVQGIAIISDSEDFVYPCGICRQVLAEFGDDDMEIICCKKNGEYKAYKLDEILPYAFRLT